MYRNNFCQTIAIGEDVCYTEHRKTASWRNHQAYFDKKNGGSASDRMRQQYGGNHYSIGSVGTIMRNVIGNHQNYAPAVASVKSKAEAQLAELIDTYTSLE